MRALSPIKSNELAKAGSSPALAYLARLGKSSRQKQADALRQIVRIFGTTDDIALFPWHQLTYTHSAALRSILRERYAPNTANRLLSAYRGTLLEAFRLGLITEDERARVSDIQNIKDDGREPAGRFIERWELDKLYEVCDKDPFRPRGLRNAAILGVLDGGGIRREECASLRYPQDWVAEERYLKVTGKGGRFRRAYLPKKACRRLREWLEVRGPTEGGLFCKVNARGGGSVQPASTVGPGRVWGIVEELCEAAGLTKLTPHDFRRTVISRFLDKNVDLVQAGRIVGHANPKTTARYDRRADAKKQAAVDLLDEE